MDIAAKTTSIRCDLHPPLSAIMYCDACRTFLCRICAEVRAGGRVCATCKSPCREPSGEEFQNLLAQRKIAKETASQVKAAEARLKEQNEKAKLDRDARLKAEFAARKAALAQQQANVNTAAVAAPGLSHFNPPAANPASVSSASAGGTMYSPAAPVPRTTDRDPLAKLGERAHINVIGRAKTYMMIIGILTVLANGVALFFVMSLTSVFNAPPSETEASATSATSMEEIRREIRKASGREMTKEQMRERDEMLAEQRAAREKMHAAFRAGMLIVELVLAAFMLVGVTMIVLFFMCERYPREATLAAFIIYLVCTLIDLFSIRSGGFIAIFFRIGALTALYNGMVAGQTLHQMRLEEAEAA